MKTLGLLIHADLNFFWNESDKFIQEEFFATW